MCLCMLWKNDVGLSAYVIWGEIQSMIEILCFSLKYLGPRNFHIELLLVVSLHNQDKIYDNNILSLTTVYLEQMVFVSDVFCQSLLLNFEIFVYIQSKLEFFFNRP